MTTGDIAHPGRPPLVQKWREAPVKLINLTDYEALLLSELGWIDDEDAVTDDCPHQGRIYDVDHIMGVAHNNFPHVAAAVASHTS